MNIARLAFVFVVAVMLGFACSSKFGFKGFDRNCTPDKRPPFDQCTPPGAWNSPYCTCWGRE